MTTHVDIDKFIASLEEQYIPRARAARKRAVVVYAEAIMGESQPLCPQSPSNKYIPGKRKKQIQNPRWTGHSGFLRDSGTVLDPVEEGENVSITLGYNTDYAAAVHEILTAKHTDGQAKYLEQPMTQMGPKLPDFVLAELQKEFGS